jgi:hypothetical protein
MTAARLVARTHGEYKEIPPCMHHTTNPCMHPKSRARSCMHDSMWRGGRDVTMILERLRLFGFELTIEPMNGGRDEVL